MMPLVVSMLWGLRMGCAAEPCMPSQETSRCWGGSFLHAVDTRILAVVVFVAVD